MQELLIAAWHPTVNPNNGHMHWRTAKKRHDIDRDTAFGAATQAGWEFIPGRVKLTITLVYKRGVRSDPDNRTARAKGLIDGLKSHVATQKLRGGGSWPVVRKAFFTDDNDKYLQLEPVGYAVDPALWGTRITLEPA